MERNSKKLAIVALLTGIAGVISIAGLSGGSSRPESTPSAVVATTTPAQDEIVVPTPLPQTQPEASRLSVAFNDDTTSTYALLKGGPAMEKISRHPDIDIWYGQYSEQDYRVLPASPVEKEPSRLNVKLSFSF
jgi:hypothetical protein